MSIVISEFLARLRKSQIKLFYSDGQLTVKAPEGKLNTPLLDELKQRKQEIVDYLQEKPGDLTFQNIQPVEEKEYYDMSHAQERFWVLHQFKEAKNMNNMPGLFILEGELDIPALNKAFRALIRRHEILRTGFITVNGIPKQVIRKEIDFAVGLHYIEEKDPGKRDRLIKRTVEQHAKTVYDLTRVPLFNVDILKPPGTDSGYIFLFNMHHIISDGWSLPIFFKQLSLFYNTGLPAFHHQYNQDPGEPGPLRIRYKDFVHWQNTYISSSASAKKQKLYWQKEFSGQLPRLNFPTDFPRPAVKTYGGETVEKTLEPTLTAAIKEIGKKCEFTLFVFLNVVVNILIYRYTAQPDIIIGTPTAGRNHPDLENQIGCYINTLALRTRVNGKESFEQYCRQVKQSITRAQDNQMYPFDRLVDDLNLRRDTSRHPLFDIMMVLQHTEPVEVTFENAVVTPQKNPFKISKFDLTFNFTPQDEKILIRIDYNTDIYKKDRIRHLAGHFTQLVKSITQNPDQAIDRLNLLSQKEIHQLLIEFNETDVDYPRNKTLMDLFADQVEQTPDQVALVGTKLQNTNYKHNYNISITYRELNNKAGHLALMLKEKGLQPDNIVGIMVERSFEMVIGILGILKAGGAYLPIDPEYPEERIYYMLEDSKVKFLLKKDNIGSHLKGGQKLFVLNFEHLNYEFVSDFGFRISDLNASNLAYVIYTSGSTGRPKGVLVDHNSIVNTLSALDRVYPFTSSDVYLLKTSYLFDVSLTELFGWFCGNGDGGGRLALLEPGGEKDPDKILEAIEKMGVTHINFVPSMFNVFVDHLSQPHRDKLSGLKYIFAAGETLLPELAKRFADLNTGISLQNLYGPTEAAIYASGYSLSHWDGSGNISIGKPIANTVVFILDRVMNPVPMGAVGELTISGDGVSRGYLNQPELTAEKFDHDSWDLWDYHDGYHRSYRSYKSYILYKTGDLARWLADGNIEFLGRRDRQVKIRGFRIELAEIEQRLSMHPGIKEAVVTAGNGELTAYVVNKPGSNVKPGKYLQEILPNYMVPTQFVQLERLPLTTAGKIDGQALEQLAKSSKQLARDNEYIPPGNETEKKLVEIWQEVLKKEKIGIYDNFFLIGGHSLKAVQIVSQIYKQMSLQIDLSAIFKNPTIAGLAEIVKQKGLSRFINILPVEKQEYYDVSNAQRRLWVLCQFQEQSISYNIPSVFSLKGELNIAALNRAFHVLIERHESLRTSFITASGVPKQRVHNKVDFKIECLDTGSEVSAQKIARQHAEWVFDLSAAPLLNVKLLKLKDRRYILLFNIHHIINDGWSMDILVKELLALYHAFAAPHRDIQGFVRLETILAPLAIQYKDYTLWQNRLLQDENINAIKEYWQKNLRGGDDIPVLNLPTDYPRPAVQTHNGSSMDWVWDKEWTSAVNNLCQKQGVTLFMGLLAAVNLLIWRYTGQDDIIIGSPAAGRHHPDLEHQVGFYVNTLALRHRLRGTDSFEEFLQQVKQTTTEAYENQIYPFDRLVDELNLSRDTSRHPLFDVMVGLQNNRQSELKFDHIEITPIESTFKTSKFDLIFGFIEKAGEILMQIEYNTDLFKKDRMQRYCYHFGEMVKNIVSDPGQTLQTIDILTEQEKHRLLIEFNDTKSDFPKDKTILDLFAEQVEQTPDNIAVVIMNACLTYRELNNKSGQLGYDLKEKGLGPDMNPIVGIMAERSLEMIIGILGILKAGGAYLPIDPDYPEERIAYMLKDSSARILATNPDLLKKFEKLSIANCQLLIINEKTLDSRRLNKPPQEANLVNNYQLTINNLQLKANNLAYIIYTSGSMGNPKGVLVRHRSLVNQLTALARKYPCARHLHHIFLVSVAFDVSVKQALLPLCTGGKLFLVPEKIKRDAGQLLNYLLLNRVDILNIPVSLMEVLLHQVESEAYPAIGFKSIIMGAEAFSTQLYRRVREKISFQKLFNIYGPTETTISATIYECGNNETGTTIPIGKPLSNYQTWILSRGFSLQPIGAAGELCISGEGLAIGYLNRPELTAEKFRRVVTGHSSLVISNSDKFLPNDRSHMLSPHFTIYRTGDLAAWRPDGNIEFLGRIDEQVKIRGYRIELGEIQEQLLKHPAIKEVAVIAKEIDTTGQKELIVYITSSRTDVEEMKLREYLNRFIPGYMIPHHFIRLDRLPLTVSGKIDKKALVQSQISNFNFQSNYSPPGNETEEKLSNVWQEVLGREKVGIDDNFFELGGDSIKAIQIVSRLYQHGIKIEIKDLFKHPFIKELAGYAGKIQRKPQQEPVVGEVPLTPIQKWFFASKFPNPHHFNQAVMLYKEECFKSDLVEKSFNEMIKHHDALRMVYENRSGHAVQQNRGVKEKLFHLEVLHLPLSGDQLAKEVEREANRVQRSINFETGPLVKLALFKTDRGDHLLIVIHHLVIDGVSWRILLEDFNTAYQALEKREIIKLPDKTDSFQYWAREQEEYAKSKKVYREMEYWKNILETNTIVLPGDVEIEEIKDDHKDNEMVTLNFTRQQTERLLEQTNHAYNTEINDILLTALGLCLQKMWGPGRILINLEGHGREEIIGDANINRTVGWFTTQFPVILDLSGYDNLSYQIRCIKETLRRVPNKGIGFGILEYLSPSREELAAYKKPAVSFNYLGEFGQEIKNTGGTFRSSELSAGDSADPGIENLYSLNINGILINGRLSLSFGYNGCEYKKNTMEKLAVLYQSALLEIIEHCAHRDHRQPTPSDYGYSRLSLENLDKISAVMGGNMLIDKIYPLSPMQEGMLFHWLLDKESAAYFEQFALHLEGKIDEIALGKSIHMVIARHDILRTAFIYKHMEKPLQVVLKKREIDLLYKDLSANSEQKTEITNYRMSDKQKGFDLTHDPLMRFALFKTAKTSFTLIWSHHHILMDGWCLSLFFKELFTIYRALVRNHTPRLEPAALFKNYIDWLEEQDREEGLKYWENYLAGFEQQTSLPQWETRLKESESTYRLEEYDFELGEEETSVINALTNLNRVTFNTLFQAAWAILLMRYNNTCDVVCGSVVSGRSVKIQGIEKTLGLFINTIPVRIQTKDKQTFSELIKEVQEQALNSRTWEYLPLADIQTNSPLKKDLIDHIIAFENYPMDKELKDMSEKDDIGPGFRVKDSEALEQTIYDFNIIIIPGKNVRLRFNYNSLVYNTELVKRIALHFNRIIKEITGDKDIKVEAIEILTHEERHHLLVEFNDNGAVYIKDRTIVDLFEEQVEKSADHIVVVNKKKHLTYQELNEGSNQLAGILRQKGVKLDTVVGIMVERSIEMIIGLLGILKSGGAYLPIDTEYPQDRIDYILKDSNVGVLLTTPKFRVKVNAEVKENTRQPLQLPLQLINIETEFVPAFETSPPTSTLTCQVSPANLAYVIYTSGSTGRPKGVMVSHSNVVRLFFNDKFMFDFISRDIWTMFHSYCFDFSVWEIFGALLFGARLIVIGKMTARDPVKYLNLLVNQAVTVLNQTPSAFFNLQAEELKHLGQRFSLR